MSTVNVLNVKKEAEPVEINDLDRVVFTDGWNGGQWNFPFGNDANLAYRFFVFYKNGYEELKAVSTGTTSGTDSDHGHQYSWERNEVLFEAKVKGPLKHTITLKMTDVIRISELWVLPVKDYVKEVPATKKPLFSA